MPGHAHWYTLKNLSPGNYAIFMQANTEAGAGAFGPEANVHIGKNTFKCKKKCKADLAIFLTQGCVFVKALRTSR